MNGDGTQGDATRTEDLTDYTSLALAGLVQAAQLVHARANGLPATAPEIAAVKRAITTQNAGTMLEVFPVVQDFRLGVRIAINAISGKMSNVSTGEATAPEVLRYCLQLAALARRLARNSEALSQVSAALDQLPTEPDDAEYASVYRQSISPLGKPVRVTGIPELLRQAAVADEIRSLLLAGVRFAWLWHQLGGSRLQLVLRRGAVLSALKTLNKTLNDH